MQTLSEGVQIPEPTDAISVTGVAEVRALGTSINTALAARQPWYRGTLTETDNLDAIADGSWGFNNTGVPAALGIPVPATGVAALGSLEQRSPYTNTNYRVQEFTSVQGYRLWRSMIATTWGAWTEWGGGGGELPDLPEHALATGNRAMRVQLFEQAYPLVSTGGLGAVVFRYDHGLTNFKGTLKPIHDQYGIPAYIAMNSRNWALAENAGATQAEAKAWAGVEWGNHTSDHNDQTGIAKIYDSVVNGRIELEEQLGKTIHGFTVPGLIANGSATDKFDGWGTGSASGYSNTYAGALIMAHHAVVSGTVGNSLRELDGRNYLGGRHYTWESASWESIKTQIDTAVAQRKALTLMCHPRTMGGSNWNAELAAQVIGYVRSLIDAGKLANISYYQSHRAQLAPVTGEAPAWKTITADGSSSKTGSTYKICRVGRTVLMNTTGLVAGSPSNGIWLTLPAGYRPIGDAARLLDTNVSGVTNPPATVTVTSGGALYARDRAGSSLADGVTLDGVIEWTTLDADPA